MNAPGSHLHAAGPMHFGEVSVDAAARTLFVAGEERHLEPKAFDLLLYLIAAHGRAVSKDELLAKVWPGRVVEEGALKQAVWLIRQTLGDDPRSPRFVRTVRGTGYRFVADPDTATPIATAVRPPWRWVVSFGALAALLLLVLVQPWRGAGSVDPVAVRALILPFANATGDTRLDWISRGLPGLVAHSLAESPSFSLIPSTVAARLASDLGIDFESDDARLVELAEVAGADHVVVGRLNGEAQAWVLDLRVLGPDRAVALRRLEAAELGDLAGQVGAHALRAALRDGPLLSAPGDPGVDPFLDELHARALASRDTGDMRNARDLLAVVVRGRPGDPHLRLDLAGAEYELGQRETVIELLKQVRQHAAAGTSGALAGRLASFEGDLAADAGDLEAARGHYRHAQRLASQRGDHLAEAEAWRALGTMFSRAGDFDEAEQHLGRALSVFSAAGHEPGRMRALNNLGVLEWRRDRIAASARWHEQALASARRQGRRDVEASSLGNLATIAFSQRRIDDARALNEQALALHRELGARRSEVLVLGNMARHSTHAARLAEARAFAEAMLDAADDLGDAALAAFARLQLGLVDMRGGAYGKAAAWFAEAAGRFQASGDIDYAISARTHQMRALISAGDSADAERLLHDTELNLQAGSTAHTRAQVALTQAWLAAANGHGGEAVERALSAQALAAETGSLDLVDTVTFDLAMFLMRSGRSDEASVWLGHLEGGDTGTLRPRLAQARFAYEAGDFDRAVQLMEDARSEAGEGWIASYEVQLGAFRQAQVLGQRLPLGDELP